MGNGTSSESQSSNPGCNFAPYTTDGGNRWAGGSIYAGVDVGLVNRKTSPDDPCRKAKGVGAAISDPRPLMYMQNFTLTTSTDWYSEDTGLRRNAPNTHNRVFGIEMAGSPAQQTAGGTPLHDANYSPPTLSGDRLVQVKTHSSNWGACQWRLRPVDAKGDYVETLKDTPVIYHEGRFTLEYVGSNPGVPGYAMRIANSSDAHFKMDSSGDWVKGIFKIVPGVSQSHDSIQASVLSSNDRNAVGRNVVYMGDEFQIQPLNGAKAYGQRCGTLRIMNAHGSNYGLAPKGGAIRLPANPPYKPRWPQDSIYAVSNWCVSELLPVPTFDCNILDALQNDLTRGLSSLGDAKTWERAAKGEANRDQNSLLLQWTDSNQTGNDYMSRNFRAYETSGPRSWNSREGPVPTQPQSCLCNVMDPDGRDVVTFGSQITHRKWCPSLGRFAKCQKSKISEGYQWESCDLVFMCDGNTGTTVCGAAPTKATCPERAHLCCDKTTKSWRCRPRDASLGVEVSCPAPYDEEAYQKAIPADASCKSTQYMCMKDGKYVCVDNDYPQLLCAFDEPATT